MTAAQATHPRTELEMIEEWRSQELVRAGFSGDEASELAARHDIDLHRATDLIQRGCAPELALRILL